ncbi:amylo-alpha-1,6-glucosidase [Skermanella stibiiresistens SB22]|uniref:Amylo-alpha-1,6-glucosidase n=2 Tax=Skermanella TaxID=204447 RepID=W9H7G1_9PROT|nr:amylo-alpha-1,6-glucosidase [Skermanella stibiiresistens SB22]
MAKTGLEGDITMTTPGPDTIQDPAAEYYIPAVGSLTDRHTRTIKHADTFAVFDDHGDILYARGRPDGLFHQDTRYLSRLELLIDGQRPLLLSTTIMDRTAVLSSDLCNPDLYKDGTHILRETLHLSRAKFLWNGACYERLVVRNHSENRVRVTLTLRYGADFADLFEARGQNRARRGRIEPPVVADDQVTLAYVGLDGVRRETLFQFDPPPTRLSSVEASIELDLGPDEWVPLFTTISVAGIAPERGGSRTGFFAALRGKARDHRALFGPVAHIVTSNSVFNETLRRSASDLAMLVTETEQGPYPYAGIPWFSTAFGRDGIITAMLLLGFAPDLAAGVLRYLAANQAVEEDAVADAEPGKILHETRGGEMASLGEVPFRRYYGSVDSTPLFVILAGAYATRTGDLGLISDIWPNIEAALSWIDDYGDRDGDGFVEYGRRNQDGLINQGWKDSHDSVFHEDGTLAEGPIALVEVQGYVFAAKRAAADLARRIGLPERAATLEIEAEALRVRFENAFWCERLGTYALALDAGKRQCQVGASNAGHALFTGIASADRAARVAANLMDATSFSGWGIRTLATSQARYNPMSYHNGSIWPHDNGLIALGFARYGHKEEAARIFQGLFESSAETDLRRLPELFCGFPRRRGRAPVSYPVACSPQAWASATLPGLLAAAIGLEFHPEGNEIRFNRPVLPTFLEEVELHGLRVGACEVDVLLRRHAIDVGVTVLRRSGPVRVVTIS